MLKAAVDNFAAGPFKITNILQIKKNATAQKSCQCRYGTRRAEERRDLEHPEGAEQKRPEKHAPQAQAGLFQQKDKESEFSFALQLFDQVAVFKIQRVYHVSCYSQSKIR